MQKIEDSIREKEGNEQYTQVNGIIKHLRGYKKL